MATRNFEINDLDGAVRRFLSDLHQDDVILIKENGEARYGVIPYRVASAAEQQQAWNDIKDIQRKVGEEMQRTGKTEEEFDRLLQDD